MPKVQNFWDYQARQQRKRETVVDIPDPPKDPWAGVEVKEHRLTDTGIIRFLAKVHEKWKGDKE